MQRQRFYYFLVPGSCVLRWRERGAVEWNRNLKISKIQKILLDIKNQDIRSIHSHVGASTLWACNVYVVLSLVSMGESPPFLQYLF